MGIVPLPSEFDGRLGRLAACFLDSIATLQLPAMGYGLRYEYGMFRQSVANGTLTVGTRNGATIEMAREAGEENFLLFGLTAQEVADSRSWYDPPWHYEHEPETRAALDLIFNDHFTRNEPGIFMPLRDALLTHGDRYMHLADLRSYLDADERAVRLYGDRDAWAHKAILNIAASGRFSSDRSIAQYASEIWRVLPCPIS